METAESEILVKLTSEDRGALEGIISLLKRDLPHRCFPSSVIKNDHDNGYHVFVNVLWRVAPQEADT